MSIITDDRLKYGCRLSVLQELIDFHDSIIEEIRYDRNSLKLIMKIELCNWRQKDYNEDTDDELLTIYLRFEGAFYQGENRVFKDEDCDGGIYHAKMKEDSVIEFVAEDKDVIVKSYIISAATVYVDLTDSKTDDSYNCILSESENYLVARLYETCYLYFKHGKYRRIDIGYIYGDAEDALIDKNERFVLLIDYENIVYYLQEPFTEYITDTQSEQWKILKKSDEGDFCSGIEQLTDDTVKIKYENGFENTLCVY